MTVIYFSISLGLLFFLHLLTLYLFCRAFKLEVLEIKIGEVGEKWLINRYNNRTKFYLSYLPINSSVSIYGLNKEETEENSEERVEKSRNSFHQSGII